MSDMTTRDQLAQIIYDTLNGQYGDFNMPDDAADKIIAAGWRPPARTIATVEELDALPEGTVIRSADGWAWQRDNHNGFWYTIASEDDSTPGDFAYYPLTVLYEPEEGE